MTGPGSGSARIGSTIRRRVRPTLPLLAGSVAGTGIVVIVLASLVWASEGFRPLPMSFGSGLPSMGAGALASATFLVVGWRLAARVPRNPIGWLLLAGGLTFVMVVPVGLSVAHVHESFRPAPFTTLLVAWIQSSFGVPA